MRKLLQRLLKKPILWIADHFASSPDKDAVFSSLSTLLANIKAGKIEQGPILPFDINTSKVIIFSDQHKGGKDMADDFRLAEPNYMAALEFYNEQEYTFVNLGDCEELWENKPTVAVEKNKLTLQLEARFLQADRYYRVFGNHDLEWRYIIPQNLYIKPVLGNKLKIYEAIAFEIRYNDHDYTIFLTHGHQGDKNSDGNAFSTWVVATLWTPIQRFLEISVNTVSDSFDLVDKHNTMMYEWSAEQEKLVFISGHTHKPVFASMDHIDRLEKELEKARNVNDAEKINALNAELQQRQQEYAGKKQVQTMLVPSYFNSGCCCFSDGDITGIEIADGEIRLVKWKQNEVSQIPERMVLEHSSISYILDELDTPGPFPTNTVVEVKS
jgi:predicted phosphodiesterase